MIAIKLGRLAAFVQPFYCTRWQGNVNQQRLFCEGSLFEFDKSIVGGGIENRVLRVYLKN
jgi:hypothetical protein